MRIVTPLRFVGGTLGLWIAARILILMPHPFTASADAADDLAGVQVERPGKRGPAEASLYPPDAPAVRPMSPSGFGLRRTASPGPRNASSAQARATLSAGAVASPAGAIALSAAPSWAGGVIAVADTLSPAGIVQPPVGPAPIGPAPIGPAGPLRVSGAAAAASRWSGNFYLYRRGEGTPALGSGGQLGGSQAGGRLAYRLNPVGPTRFAAAARLSAALDDRRQTEAAVGLDFHPLPATPLRLSIERRVDVGGRGRDAWSAYAAGGFWREVRPGLVVDGYAQAGMVGARSRDLFADGALRAGYRRPLGQGATLTLGAGSWAAAQPRAERLDIGPRFAVSLPAGGTTLTGAAEWRIRVAGDAAPRSGLALTLAADF